MPSTNLELEDLPRNYLLNRLDNLYLNPLVELAFPSKNWLPNMEFLPGMLRMAKKGVTYRKRKPCPRYSPGQAERARLQRMILEERRAAGRHQVSECWNKISTKSWWSWSLLSAKPCLEDSRLRAADFGILSVV